MGRPPLYTCVDLYYAFTILTCVMVPNQSFHLQIDNNIHFIPISMDPVQFGGVRAGL